MPRRKETMRDLRNTLDNEKIAGYVCISPFIIGLFVFTVIPFFTSLYLAFTQYDILTDPKWIGLGNFHRMFTEDKYFWKSFWITVRFAVIQVPIKLAVSLGVALILARVSKAISIYRAAFYVPSIRTCRGRDSMILTKKNFTINAFRSCAA